LAGAKFVSDFVSALALQLFVQPSGKAHPLPKELYSAPADRPTVLDRHILVL
jgi:hypothetical protein